MLALKTVNSVRHIDGVLCQLLRSTCGHLDFTYFLAFPYVVVPGTVEPYAYSEGPASFGSEEQIEFGTVALLGSGKRLKTVLCLVKAAESEVLVTHDFATGHGNGHVVVPDVP